ncbi:MAG: PAS domain-containing protein [Rhodospirillaceae bacterium]|nr:PAS domain-containing protein [Rhodospirillaceae bacterium]
MTDTRAINPREETLDFKSSIVKDCYSYWRGKVIGDRLPSRSDIDPVDIPKLMPHAVILDVRREPELDFRYRLIGNLCCGTSFQRPHGLVVFGD